MNASRVGKLSVLLLGAGLTACDSDSSLMAGMEEEGSTGRTSAGGSGVEGETEGERETEADTETVDPADPLAVCRALDEAEGWEWAPAEPTAAESSEARMAAAAAQTWSLGLRLLREVPVDDATSVVASPTSMMAAMGLSYARWQDQSCGDRIAEVMAFPETGEAMHQTIAASLQELASRSLEAAEGTDPVVVGLNPSVWDFGDAPPEATPILELYGASRHVLPAPNEDARAVINCVVEQQTQGLLAGFLPEGQPRGDTTSYDLHLAYLQAPWATGMEERSFDFTFVDGSVLAVDGFGSRTTEVMLHESEAFTMVELSLRGGDLAVMVVLPDASQTDIEAFAEALDPETLAVARQEARDAYVDLSMPRVQIDPATIDYNEGRLDFDCEPFTLRAVLHAAAVKMDAKGIEAAAASANEGWADGGEPEPERELVVDRPFLFFIYDRPTEYVLFSGRYAPEQGG